MKLTTEFTELNVTKGTYQLEKANDVMEIAISDTKPVNGSGVVISGTEVRNFDGGTSKVWARATSGEIYLRVVPGFL